MIVIIIAQSRSGSSLLTKIFHAHGLETGAVRPAGRYANYESLSVHNFFQANKEGTAHSKRKDNDLTLAPMLRDAFLGSIDGNAVLKVMVQHEDLAREAFPDAKFVYLMRDSEAVGKSLWKKGRTHLKPDAMVPHAKLRNGWILAAAEKHGCPIIQMSRIMEGDLSSLEIGFDYCGIKLSPKIVESCIDRNLWTCQ
jgi:hypothetical protein